LARQGGPDGCAALAFDQAQDVGFLEDQPRFAVDQHFRAGPLAQRHAIGGLDVERGLPSGLWLEHLDRSMRAIERP
jgi:hypothetical protein